MNSSPPTPTTWAPGILIPGTGYRIVRPLGQGGMGEVFEVEHDMLGTRKAVKVLAREFAGRQDLEQRLRVEARALARLRHPNLVEVYDLAVASDSRIFFIMELLDGGTLRELLQHRGKLSPIGAVRVIAQALDGLAAAHSTQLVHRDIKPENVFICRNGTTKLLDFGIAKAIDASMPDPSITGAGMTVGTPRYMAPEQALGRPVDKRADVYAAGLVLWEAITGVAAFPGDQHAEIAHAKLFRGAPPLDPRFGAPESLDAAIARACSPDPGRRFATADAFAMEIRRAVGEPLQPWAVALTPRTGPVAFDVPPPPPAGSQPPPTDTTLVNALRSSPTIDECSPEVADTIPDAVLRELTERVDAFSPVDRGAPTRDPIVPVRPITGPTGTEMLPAVAAQLAPTLAAEPPVGSTAPQSVPSPSLQVTAPPVTRAAPADGPKPARSPARVILAVVALAVPVSVAAFFGFLGLLKSSAGAAASASEPAVAAPAATTAEAGIASTAAVDAQPVPHPAASAPPAPPPGQAGSAAPTAPGKTAQPSAPTKTESPPAPVPTASPPKPPAKKTVRPASGL